MSTASSWNSEAICVRSEFIPSADTRLSQSDVKLLALQAYQRTCRVTFDAPGCCVLNLGNSVDSVQFRQLMGDIKLEMARIHRERSGKTLIYVSATRFDQQQSTKPHLDGGPEESLLMLGYEPSEIPSELQISDYSRCAFEMGISPEEFMAKHNPLFQANQELLQPYVTTTSCFQESQFQIVFINNSSATYDPDKSQWQGVLHTAKILKPDDSKRRIINSTMIAPAELGTADLVEEQALQHFIQTSEVKRRGYDKPHLEDDK